MFNVLLEEEVSKELEKLQRGLKDAVVKRLKLLEQGFSPVLDIKKLKGYRNHYRLRIGKLRILFCLENPDVVVYKIGKRENVYG